MDESLVDSPDFKPARGALTLSQIGSIPMHLRHIHIRLNFYKSTILVIKLIYQTVISLQASIHIHSLKNKPINVVFGAVLRDY